VACRVASVFNGGGQLNVVDGSLLHLQEERIVTSYLNTARQEDALHSM
jgi:hypothetical protein